MNPQVTRLTSYDPFTTRREPPTLNPQLSHHLVSDRHAALRAEADAERAASAARRARGHPADELDPAVRPGHGFRTTVGRALIGLGAAIAAVPGDDESADAGVGHPA